MRLRRRFVKDEDRRKLNKVMIPLIRKQLPSIIANQIVGVQPMTGSMTNIFKLKTKYAAESWRKKIMWLPKKSIYGKTLFGLVNERGVWKDVHEALSGQDYKTHTERVIEYATNKELFKAKLEGRDE